MKLKKSNLNKQWKANLFHLFYADKDDAIVVRIFPQNELVAGENDIEVQNLQIAHHVGISP